MIKSTPPIYSLLVHFVLDHMVLANFMSQLKCCMNDTAMSSLAAIHARLRTFTLILLSLCQSSVRPKKFM